MAFYGFNMPPGVPEPKFPMWSTVEFDKGTRGTIVGITWIDFNVAGLDPFVKSPRRCGWEYQVSEFYDIDIMRYPRRKEVICELQIIPESALKLFVEQRSLCTAE